MQGRCSKAALLTLAWAAWPVLALAQTQPAPQARSFAPPNPPAVLRDARYCEILPVTLTLSGLKAEVYNTIGYDDCPQAAWSALSEKALRKQFGAVTVILNGPRHFLMDKIIPKGATAAGKVITFDGITLESRAELSLSLFELLEKPYGEHIVDRETVYRFDAGKPTFRLTAPDGAVYVMQSYAQMVDPALTYETLPGLGAKLKLPSGWRYDTVTPETDLLLHAEGKAVVIQDDLKNTYQKMTP
ncbi:hypothetical protein [Aquabacter cavernae]|uniref:hypothetical protein n=1 Tax=Aquabacter cavernae TaxID=2496029 RepID=UPI000F8E9301|nr:hypothetical protein [Aquabacter cavernae]